MSDGPIQPPIPTRPLSAKARLLPPLVATLTLGLAPGAPEPHVLGKLRWVLGGAVGMQPIDWGDLLFHGAPWLWLGWTVIGVLRGK